MCIVKQKELEKEGWLSQKGLIAKAMAAKGATLDRPVVGSHFYNSEPIYSFELTGLIETGLKISGFEVAPSEKDGTELIFRTKHKSYYQWRFAPGEKVTLTLSTYNHLDYESGITLIPSINRNIYSQDDCLPGIVAFIIAAANFGDVPKVVREIAHKKGPLLVSWSDIDLEEIKSIQQLWKESSKDYPSREYLPRIGIIKPDPEPANPGYIDDFEIPRFIPKELQGDTLLAWEKQIMDFAAGLQ